MFELWRTIKAPAVYTGYSLPMADRTACIE